MKQSVNVISQEMLYQTHMLNQQIKKHLQSLEPAHPTATTLRGLVPLDVWSPAVYGLAGGMVATSTCRLPPAPLVLPHIQHNVHYVHVALDDNLKKVKILNFSH